MADPFALYATAAHPPVLKDAAAFALLAHTAQPLMRTDAVPFALLAHTAHPLQCAQRSVGSQESCANKARTYSYHSLIWCGLGMTGL
jgi:hypothetical protein